MKELFTVSRIKTELRPSVSKLAKTLKIFLFRLKFYSPGYLVKLSISKRKVRRRQFLMILPDGFNFVFQKKSLILKVLKIFMKSALVYEKDSCQVSLQYGKSNEIIIQTFRQLFLILIAEF